MNMGTLLLSFPVSLAYTHSLSSQSRSLSGMLDCAGFLLISSALRWKMPVCVS